MAQPNNNTQLSSAFKTFFERETLSGVNFNDWYRTLRIVLRVADTYDYNQPLETASEEDKAAWKAEYKKHNDAVEIYNLVDALHSCKQAPSLNKDFGDFVRNFNMHCVGKKVTELHALLIDYEKGLKDKAPTPQVLTIQKGRENKPKPQANKKDKSKGKTDKNKKVVPYQPKPKHNPLKRKENPNKDQTCHHCYVARHWKRNCPLYLEELRKHKDKAEHGAAALGNGAQAAVEAIEVFDLVLPSGLVLKLNNCYYAPSILRGLGCEAYMKRDSDKLHQRSVKCVFVGYPKETMGYYFYFSPENKVIVARYENFLERDFISQKFSGRDNDLEDDHMDTLPSENTSKIPVESKSLGSPPELIPVCRTTRAPNRLCLNIEVEDDEVGDLREVANYKAAMLDPDKKYNMHNSKKGYLPMEVKHDLSNELCASTPEEVAYIKKVPYASDVGSIMYVVRCIRPDVALAQNLVSRYQQNPGKLHWVTVKHIRKYLRNTRDMFLMYGGKPDTELVVISFCEASWQSASETAMEAVWIRKFVGDLGVMSSINKRINMYCDNSAAIIFANEPKIMKGARHFLRRYQYVREQVETGEIKLIEVHTDVNLADPFAKALPKGMVIDHAKGIGLQLASSFMHTCD
nr:hypothetical protein [Tanacetum cinerariifolium]